MNRILIATDGSEASGGAVEEGLALARDVEAAVTFVYVRSRPSSVLGEPFYQHALSHESAAAHAAIEAAMAQADEYGVEADYEIFEGDPVEKILRVAMSRDVDMIVLGSRGLGAFKGTLLGSVSRAIAREADRPVLIARERTAPAIHAVA
jgi:nucleotide-binding universal stress UspA family protein